MEQKRKFAPPKNNEEAWEIWRKGVSNSQRRIVSLLEVAVGLRTKEDYRQREGKARDLSNANISERTRFNNMIVEEDENGKISPIKFDEDEESNNDLPF